MKKVNLLFIGLIISGAQVAVADESVGPLEVVKRTVAMDVTQCRGTFKSVNYFNNNYDAECRIPFANKKELEKVFQPTYIGGVNVEGYNSHQMIHYTKSAVRVSLDDYDIKITFIDEADFIPTNLATKSLRNKKLTSAYVTDEVWREITNHVSEVTSLVQKVSKN